MIEDTQFFCLYYKLREELSRLGWKFEHEEPKQFQHYGAIGPYYAPFSKMFQIWDQDGQRVFSAASLGEVQSILRGISVAQKRWFRRLDGESGHLPNDVVTETYKKDIETILAYEHARADYEANEKAKHDGSR